MANEEFKKVLKAVQKGNPEYARWAKAEANRKKRVAAAEKEAERARKRRKGAHRGGDDVIDTGMFG